MKFLAGFLRFTSLAFGWYFLLIVLCFISKMSWSYAVWLVSAVAITVLYTLPPKVLCRDSFPVRLVLILYCCAIAGFIAVSIVAVSKLGTGPVLLHARDPVGSSRNWGIAIAVIMTLCAITGPIHLLVSRKIMRGDDSLSPEK